MFHIDDVPSGAGEGILDPKKAKAVSWTVNIFNAVCHANKNGFNSQNKNRHLRIY